SRFGPQYDKHGAEVPKLRSYYDSEPSSPAPHIEEEDDIDARGKHDLFDEWMNSIERFDAFMTDKPTDMGIEQEATDYMDIDPAVLMLKEEGAYWEPPVIVEFMIELKNWAWEGATHPMEDSVRKIKTVKSVTFAKKIKTAEPITPAKNIISVLIESISTKNASLKVI
ncbi:hypothetical protein SO802_031893, partial [Lithocarpus litseifolius]